MKYKLKERTKMKKPENRTQGSTQKNAEKVRDFEVLRTKMWDNGGVSADLKINGVSIYGVRVVEGKKGDFLSFPQRKGSDGKYYHIAYFPLCEEDQRAILSEIERKLNGGE